MLNEGHRIEVNDLNKTIRKLNSQLEDETEKNLIKRLKKELDEIKIRFRRFSPLYLRLERNDKENDELREERDKHREEKNELMMKFSK